MPRWNPFKREHDEDEHPPEEPAPQRPAWVGGPDRQIGQPTSPQLRERKLQRLEQRLRDLQFDVDQAALAQQPENHWNTRVAGINAAIEQARKDQRTLENLAPEHEPFPLPPTPVVVTRASAAEPAEVVLTIGGEEFKYNELLDWAERGFQKAPVELRRTSGDLETLIPENLPAERHAALLQHLAHSLAIAAEHIRQDAGLGRESPSLTLADLAQPCPKCGGWRDMAGRCLVCQERTWQIDTIQQQLDRMLRERNEHLDELAKFRERLPLLQMQLAETRAEIEALRAAE